MAMMNLLVRGSPYNSYGKIQLALIRQFKAMGIEVNVIGDLHPHGTEWLERECGSDWLEAHYQKPVEADVTLAFYKPQDALPKKKWLADRLWLLTMSESTAVSEKWVEAINERYERVFVAAPELVNIYAASGVQVPVHCVPLGLDFEPFPEPVARQNHVAQFIWLTQSVGDGRKGAELAVQAFKKAFGDDARQRLWIKSRYAADTWIGQIDDPQVYVVPGRLSEWEWQELLRNAQAFIWMTHGEGFGLPIREAVLTGMPAIGTQWLGMHDIDQWGWPVPVARMEEAYPQRSEEQMEANAPGAMWAVPDVDEASGMMQRVAEKYEDALKIAQRGREYLMSGFTYEKTAEAMVQWLQQQQN